MVNFETFAEIKDRVHVDVRNKPEWAASGVVENCLLISLPEVEAKINEVKGKKNIVISCLTGMRSKVAWSLMARHGV